MSGVRLGIGGICFEIEGDDPELERRVVELLSDTGFQRLESQCGSPARIEVEPGASVVSSEGALEVARHHQVRVLRTATNGLVIHDERSRVDIDPGQQSIRMQLAEELRTTPVRGRGFLLVLYSVLTYLRFRGLYPLHGAGVARNGEPACLLVGASQTGKTTMTMDLVRHGWRWLSDDSLALHREGDRIEAIAMRSDAFSRESDSPFRQREGWLEGKDGEHSGKYRVPLRRTYESQWLPSAPVGVIVMPALTKAETSSWARCSREEALFLLLEHSSIADLEPSSTPAHVELLRDLVLQSPSYRLEAGTDLRNNGTELDRLLSHVMADAEQYWR